MLRMYLRGSKWSMRHRKRRPNPFRIAVLVILVGAAIYINQIVVPTTQPLFVPTPTVTRSPQSYVADAQALYDSGKLTQAVENYKQAIRVDPKNVSIYQALSRLQIYTNDYEGALESAENALLLSPNNSMAYAYRGWAQFFLGNYPDSEASLTRAIELDEKNALAHAFYAELIATQESESGNATGNMQKAIDEAGLARDLGPDLLETHRIRGIIQALIGNPEGAVEEFRAAIEINKNIADLHLRLGVIFRGMDPPDYDNAIAEFNKAIPLNPTDPMPNIYLTRTYLQMGQYAKAAQYGMVAITNGPTDPYNYGNLGSVYYKMGDYPKAIENLRLAIRGGKGLKEAEVEGIPLSHDQRVLEFYNRYGLALARANQCGEAAQVAAALIQNIGDDEDTVYNANEMLKICQENVTGTATPTVDGAPEAEATKAP